MVKLDIINGFLGAGKTTLINKLLKEGMADENPVLIENEFGSVSIDHELISSDVEVKLLASRCICCLMKGDFINGIISVIEKYHPGRIIIEPTGLANLEDVIGACKKAGEQTPLQINSVITVVNAHNFPVLMNVGGPFFQKQVKVSFISIRNVRNALCQTRHEKGGGTVKSAASSFKHFFVSLIQFSPTRQTAKTPKNQQQAPQAIRP